MRTWITLLGTAAIGLAVNLPAQANPEANMKTAGCFACHAVDKIVGPGYNEVVAKYKGQADAEAKLVAKVKAGGKGVWGQIPMPPNPVAKISDADLKAAVEWILKQ